MKIFDAKCFGYQMDLKRADEKCFSDHVVNEKCLSGSVFMKRGDGRVFSNHVVGRIDD
jgi:hypothetical protein